MKSAAVPYKTLILILLLGAFLRTWTLFRVELWRDELWSLDNSRSNLTAELNHSLHLILVAPFTRTMPDVVGIRIVSFWAGIITIAATARLGYRLRSKSVGLVAAFLVAIAPFLIGYSQEGRDYMLAAAFTTLGLVFWLEGCLWFSSVFFLGGILSVSLTVAVIAGIDLTTVFFLWRSPGQLPTSTTRGTKFKIPTWLIAHGFLYVSFLSMSFLVAHSPAGTYLPIIYPSPVGNAIARYGGLMQCGEGTTACLSLTFVLWPILIAGVVLLAILGRLQYRGVLMLMAGLVPFLTVIGLVSINYGIFVPRHALMSLPSTLCLWALLIVQSRRWAPFLVMILVLQAGFALSAYYKANPYKPNWREIVTYVDSKRSNGEQIVTARVLLDMLSREASYHFGEPVKSIIPGQGSYWFIAIPSEQPPATCQPIQDFIAREVSLYHCN